MFPAVVAGGGRTGSDRPFGEKQQGHACYDKADKRERMRDKGGDYGRDNRVKRTHGQESGRHWRAVLEQAVLEKAVFEKAVLGKGEDGRNARDREIIHKGTKLFNSCREKRTAKAWCLWLYRQRGLGKRSGRPKANAPRQNNVENVVVFSTG